MTSATDTGMREVIGSGPAGHTAALCTAPGRLKLSSRTLCANR